MSTPKHDTTEEIPQQLQERKPKLRRNDSLEVESGKLDGRYNHRSKGGDWSMILHLAFQSIGVAFGDLGTSPLYVYPSAFTDVIKHNDDIIGVLSLIYYTLAIIPLIKYASIELRANDNGDVHSFSHHHVHVCTVYSVCILFEVYVDNEDFKFGQPQLLD
ncbi:unnamed protein product [Fraxinus pennsylvanica]|uniref:K+ potassium transporter integral membrane domain-containing protein n=1 Tax=Fraxinus pennsylvanica TaxID=56036 RepID=A0AAD2A415_9LAMI|nr:unnamed protein product [Fraxinus pennsylvanica]